MSTLTLKVLELVKSLPPADQEFIRSQLERASADPEALKSFPWQLTASGDYYNPDGIPNEDQIFSILDQIESQRHLEAARPLPIID